MVKRLLNHSDVQFYSLQGPILNMFKGPKGDISTMSDYIRCLNREIKEMKVLEQKN